CGCSWDSTVWPRLGQRADPAALPGVGRNEDQDQRHRARADRHRSHQDRHSGRVGQDHGAADPAEPDGDAGGSGGDVLVPAERPGRLDHRSDLQCRRRTDNPVIAVVGDAERSDEKERRIVSDHVRLGYIGLGNMGTPMAKKMVEWPGGLMVYDIRREAMTPLAERGASLADSVADVAAADIISVTVLNDEQVRNVVSELASSAKPGTIIAIHSTISDTTAVELARDLEPQDIHVIDAPISGGGRAARFGQLATMVGASDEIFARVKGPFSHWAELVVH